jgi:enediyne biosynthesis protein E4
MTSSRPFRGRGSTVVLCLFCLRGLCSCETHGTTPGPPSDGRAAPVPARRAAVTASAQFTDVAAAAGLSFRHVHGSRRPLTIVETMGSGCAFLDYDGDGWLDVFLVQSGEEFHNPHQQSHSRLFRNTGDGRFEDVTEQAHLLLDGYGMGCCAGDYNNDGDTDLYVTNYGRSNVLLRNNGDGTFTDVTRQAGVGGAGELWSTSCAFADVNSDGWLDLYVVNYVRYDPRLPYCSFGRLQGGCPPNVYTPQRNLLFINNADGTFTERAKEAGVDNPGGAGLGVVCADFDDDGRADLFVANDKTPNALFHNLGGGHFTDSALTAGVGYSENGTVQAGMGTDAGDVDGDGRLDLVVTNFQYEPNSLFHNLGANHFTDAAFASGLGVPSLLKLGFGVAFLDYDLDGDEDLYVGNGHVFDNVQEIDPAARYAQQDQLFENVKRGRFVEVSGSAGAAFEAATVTRGVAIGDFDNNGTPDVLCNDSDGPVRLLKNEPRHRRHWLGLSLRGTVSNRSAIGARVEVRTPYRLQVKEVRSGSSYLSQSDPRLLFGLGGISDPASVKVKIRWPSAHRQTLTLRGVDRFVPVTEPRLN